MLRSLSTFSLRFIQRGASSTALMFKEFGGPENVLHKTERDLGSLQDDEVIVKMCAAPINPADINTIQGVYPIKPDLPAVAGNEGVGRVSDCLVYHITCRCFSPYCSESSSYFGLSKLCAFMWFYTVLHTIIAAVFDSAINRCLLSHVVPLQFYLGVRWWSENPKFFCACRKNSHWHLLNLFIRIGDEKVYIVRSCFTHPIKISFHRIVFKVLFKWEISNGHQSSKKSESYIITFKVRCWFWCSSVDSDWILGVRCVSVVRLVVLCTSSRGCK